MALRKMLGSADSPYIVSLMRLIETQSKPTIIRWCVDYAEQHVVPIFEKQFAGDTRPREALTAARRWLAGEIKLPEARRAILASHAAARECEGFPAAQAAARAAGQAASTVHMPAHALGIAFYGAAAIVYDRDGTDKDVSAYDAAAARECARMEAALRAVAVLDEPCPAKISWRHSPPAQKMHAAEPSAQARFKLDERAPYFDDVLRLFAPYPEALPLCEAAFGAIIGAFPSAAVKVGKTQIGFSNRYGFAYLWPPTRRFKGWPVVYAGLSFGLGRRIDDRRIVQCPEPYPGRFTHHVLITSPGDIDAQLMQWLNEAYQFSLSKTRRPML